MAWEEEMVEILRVLTNDLEEPPTVSSDRLERVLMVAALQVMQECDFNGTYEVDVLNIDIDPDPTDEETREESFVNLVCLKAACIMDRGAASTAASQAIAVRDGSSSIDLRGPLQGKLELLKRGWCAVYSDAKFEHELQSVPVAGQAIMTPFRAYAEGRGFYITVPGRGREGLY